MKPLKSTIIIKKVKKKGHEGHHGGSWKVAYADFVTAMMAFFLLLWLISMVAPEKRARISEYFRTFSLFEKSGSSMLLESHGQIVGDPSGEVARFGKDVNRADAGALAAETLKEILKREIEKKLSDVKDQIMVDIFEGGVRIQIVDKEGKPMFPLASAEPTPDAKRILQVIAENIKDIDKKIAIEGHTDALSYSTNRYTNWELSTERASSARKELENNGLNPDMLTRVAGYAATDPLIKDDPHDPRNRRISIILLYQSNIENANNKGN